MRNDGDEHVLAWLRGVRSDAAALGVLDRARRMGADLPRILIVAAVFVGSPRSLDGARYVVRIGPVQFRADLAHDIDELLTHEDAVEKCFGVRTAAGNELRRVKQVLDAQVGDIARLGEPPIVGLVPDGNGGSKERKFIPLRAGVLATDCAVEQESPALGKGRGRRGEPALNVLALMTVRHLRAMDGGATVEFAAKLLVEGLRIGVGDGAGGAADANQAMVRRMYRLLEGQHADCWRRAERIACALGLPTRDL